MWLDLRRQWMLGSSVNKWLGTEPMGSGPACGLGMTWVPVCHGGGPYAGTTMFWRCPLYSSPLWPMGPEGLDLPDGAGQWVQTQGATTSGLSRCRYKCHRMWWIALKGQPRAGPLWPMGPAKGSCATLRGQMGMNLWP